MGSGCSSPLKRLGAKKAKPSEQHSSAVKMGDESDDILITTRPMDNGLAVSLCEMAKELPPPSLSLVDDRDENNTGQSSKGLVLDARDKNPESSGSDANTLGLSSCAANDSQLLISPALSPALSECPSPAAHHSLQATTSSASLASAQSGANTQQRLRASQSSGYSAQMQYQQKIFINKDDNRHVVVSNPSEGRLTVWDIFEDKTVRSISNVDQPRDLRMIDHKRAVVLCNRELRVYDLETGEMLTKLKGIMNQKMPFFEVFGQDYVIALARNRMYVNMLNIKTGELETTFKVGEDRFLNSLLVSANGGICVCGDETQKPFPLLVWNLNERRLMYDLRLDKHEFLTRMSAISDDGHFVVCVCRQVAQTTTEIPSQIIPITEPDVGYTMLSTAPNFIVIYDLTSGTLFKKWRPGADTCAVAMSLPSDNSCKVLNSINNNTILVWDLTTGCMRHTLAGHSAPADVIKVQNNRLLSMDSTCRDRGLRLWDIERGQCLGVYETEAKVSFCQLSSNGTAVVCCLASDPKIVIHVFDQDKASNDAAKLDRERESLEIAQPVSDKP